MSIPTALPKYSHGVHIAFPWYYHSIDAEAELTSMLSEYISMEIDLEILDMLITNASTTEYWSAEIGQEWNNTTSNFEQATNHNSYAYTYARRKLSSFLNISFVFIL